MWRGIDDGQLRVVATGFSWISRDEIVDILTEPREQSSATIGCCKTETSGTWRLF